MEATVRYAAELGYDVTVIKDATADYSDEEMHAALDVNIPNYASAIGTTDEIVASIVISDGRNYPLARPVLCVTAALAPDCPARGHRVIRSLPAVAPHAIGFAEPRPASTRTDSGACEGNGPD